MSIKNLKLASNPQLLHIISSVTFYFKVSFQKMHLDLILQTFVFFGLDQKVCIWQCQNKVCILTQLPCDVIADFVT